MTAGLPLPRLVTAAAAEVAEAVVGTDLAGPPRSLHVCRVRRSIMLLIRLLPEGLFLRTRL